MPARARRVFVIDDDHSVRRGLARLLAAAGFQVEAFESAAAFLERRPPRGNHCLIVDVRMPGMSGPALRDALRAAGRDSPVIFVTAHEIEEIGEEVAKETMLSKPIEADVLLRAIDVAMGTYASRTARRARLARR
ncbi:MAG TPA: response regulator [Myxococcales bacterium]|nr:response regulator [Myxococcales bacterium]